MVQLIPDVYSLIISHLRRELPRPNGRNERSSIRQPELVTLMRVSKLFNNLTAPYLYTIVVTDHLPSLIYNSAPPIVIPGIRTKAKLMVLTKRLFLEYTDKSPPTYTTLMRDGPSSFSLVEPNELGLEEFCWAELNWIATSIAWLKQNNKVSTLSTGAFLPSQIEIWAKRWKKEPRSKVTLTDRQQLLFDTKTQVANLISHFDGCPRPAICNRIAHGPLSFTNVFCDNLQAKIHKKATRGRDGIDHHIHIESPYTYEAIPAAPGATSSWYCYDSSFEPTDEAAKGDSLEFYPNVGRVAAVRAYTRANLKRLKLKEGEASTEADKWAVSVYIPRAIFKAQDPPGSGSIIERGIEHTIKGTFRRQEHVAPANWREEWHIKILEDAPACKACGWRFEDDAHMK